jgi:SAM-dependent methyltransferase
MTRGPAGGSGEVRAEPPGRGHRLLVRCLNLSHTWGFDPVSFAVGVASLPRYFAHLVRYRRSARDTPFALHWGPMFPVLSDFRETAGSARGHYFHQDLWAARKIFAARPPEHMDVGSRVDGFVAHVLTFMPVRVIDIRPLQSDVEGLSFVRADATDLREVPDQSVASISSLHAVEHFGLGRYGDPVEPDAWRRAMRAMARVLAPGGRLYFSVPVGQERVEFNSHRVFAPRTVLDAFEDLELVSFAAVDDRGNLVDPAQPEDFAGAYFACGLFEFTRR